MSIRRTNIRTPSPPSTNTSTPENRIIKLEEEQQDHTKLLKEIIRSIKDPERRTGSRSPQKNQDNIDLHHLQGLNLVVNVSNVRKWDTMPETVSNQDQRQHRHIHFCHQKRL